MPETKSAAKSRARRVGIPVSQVVKGPGKGYFIAPRGIKKAKVKRAYAAMRARGYSKAKAAKIAHSIQRKK
jgi:hypothetical protein